MKKEYPDAGYAPSYNNCCICLLVAIAGTTAEKIMKRKKGNDFELIAVGKLTPVHHAGRPTTRAR